MRQLYQTLGDYHTTGTFNSVQSRSFNDLSIWVVGETANDVTVSQTTRNALVIDLNGTSRHLMTMDGMTSHEPTRAGEVCYIPKGAWVRSAWETQQAEHRYVSIEFDNGLFERYVPEIATDRFVKGNLLASLYEPKVGVASLASLLAREVDQSQSRGQLFAESAIRLLALEIAANGWSQASPSVGVHSRLDPRLQRAIDFIEEHLTEDISLLEICRAAGVSATHMTGQFKKYCGQTPYSYVIERRLKRAADLLAHSSVGIAEIALDSGFGDQQHMTRLFSARLGTTPKAFRMAARGDQHDPVRME